jgi:hypothetical protein
MVTMADGSRLPISRIKVGARVMAMDTATGTMAPETVTATDIHRDDDLMDVYISTANGIAVIHATDLHPFWDQSTSSWTLAENLKKGDLLSTGNGTSEAVARTDQVSGARNMWDLTVANDHDFYVSVGAGSQTAVLVHNCPAQSVTDGTSMSTGDALDTASDFLGENYSEVDNGVFQSPADENGVFRQVRMTDNDLVEDPAGPHLNFEEYQQGIRGNTQISNAHVFLPEESQ